MPLSFFRCPRSSSPGSWQSAPSPREATLKSPRRVRHETCGAGRPHRLWCRGRVRRGRARDLLANLLPNAGFLLSDGFRRGRRRPRDRQAERRGRGDDVRSDTHRHAGTLGRRQDACRRSRDKGRGRRREITELSTTIDSLARSGLPFYIVPDVQTGDLGRQDTLTRGARFLSQVRTAHPWLVMQSLDTVVDRLRAKKSAAEVALLRKAAQISARGHQEAMKATAPAAARTRYRRCSRDLPPARWGPAGIWEHRGLGTQRHDSALHAGRSRHARRRAAAHRRGDVIRTLLGRRRVPCPSTGGSARHNARYIRSSAMRRKRSFVRSSLASGTQSQTIPGKQS